MKNLLRISALAAVACIGLAGCSANRTTTAATETKVDGKSCCSGDKAAAASSCTGDKASASGCTADKAAAAGGCPEAAKNAAKN